MAQLALAPASFTVSGRGDGRTVTIGGGSLVHSPVGGPPFVSDLERGRREGTIADHVELVKLAHASDRLPMLQSGTTEAQDLEHTSRHMEMDYSILRWSDRPFILYGTSGEKTRDGIALATIAAGGAQAIRERPMVVGIVNPNSPLVWDGLMVTTLVACAEARSAGRDHAVPARRCVGAGDARRRAVPPGGRDAVRGRDGAAGAPGCAVHPRLLLQRRRHALGRSLAGAAGVGADDVRGCPARAPVRAPAARRRRPVLRRSRWTRRRPPRARCRCGPPTSPAATSSCTPRGGWRAASPRRTRSSSWTSR